MMIILFSVLALALGFLVFKLSFKLFSFGLRLVLFGVTAGFVLIPAILGLIIF